MADYSFWLGLAAAIPLSVAANLLTPVIQRNLEARTNRITAKQRGQLLDEYAHVVKFRANRSRFLEYLVLVVVRTAYISSVAAVGISLFAYGPKLLLILPVRWKIDLELFTLIPSAIFSVSCATVISSICGEALRITRGVRHFSVYQAEVCNRFDGAIPETLPQSSEET